MRAGDDERIINYGWPYLDKNLVTILSVTLHYNSINLLVQTTKIHFVIQFSAVAYLTLPCFPKYY